MLEIINTTATPLTEGGTIPFANATFQTNNKATFNSTTNEIRINTPGIYEIKGNFVIEPTDAGDYSVALYANGVAVQGGISTITVGAADDSVQFVIDKYIRVSPALLPSIAEFTFVVTGAGTLTNAVASVYKVS